MCRSNKDCSCLDVLLISFHVTFFSRTYEFPVDALMVMIVFICFKELRLIHLDLLIYFLYLIINYNYLKKTF